MWCVDLCVCVWVHAYMHVYVHACGCMYHLYESESTLMSQKPMGYKTHNIMTCILLIQTTFQGGNIVTFRSPCKLPGWIHTLYNFEQFSHKDVQVHIFAKSTFLSSDQEICYV